VLRLRQGPFVITKVSKLGTYKLANSQGEVYSNRAGKLARLGSERLASLERAEPSRAPSSSLFLQRAEPSRLVPAREPCKNDHFME
jgi:hypothetical protein